MRYEWQGPQAPKHIAVDDAVREITRIQQRDGGATPAALVEESRPPMAPLHTAFEWDDSVAAEQYRQEQARQVIRAVVLVPEPEKREQTPVVRAFVSIANPAGPNPQSRMYKPVLAVLENPAEADELKRRLRNDLLRLRQRYLNIIEMDDMLKEQMQQLIAIAS